MIKTKTEDGYLIRIPKEFHGYKCIKNIGYGWTSVVELVQEKKTGKKYSAKIVSVTDIKKKNLMKSIEKEIAILDVIDHPHIIKMKEYFEIKNKEDEQFIVMIMEYCEKGELLSLVYNTKMIKAEQKKKIFMGVLDAIKYLHKRGISHGDIKAENILLTQNNFAKLCDFGFCRTTVVAGDDSKYGTLYYASPELYETGKFDPFKADIYAIGMTLYSIYELNFPFKDGSQDEIITQTLKGQLLLNPKMDKQLYDLVLHCLDKNPKKRPTINEVINHEFFDLYHWENSMKNNNFNERKLLAKKVNNIEESSSTSHESTSYENQDVNSYESVLTY